MPEPTRKSVFQLSVRTAIAAAAAIAIAGLLHLDQPIQSVITAVLVMDLSGKETRRNAVGRFLGTLLGAALGAVLSLALPPHPLAVGAGILATMLIANLLRLRNTARLAAFVCAIVQMGHATAPWSYAVRRLEETTLGIVMAVAVSSLPFLLGDDSLAQEASD